MSVLIVRSEQHLLVSPLSYNFTYYGIYGNLVLPICMPQRTDENMGSKEWLFALLEMLI